MYAFLVLVRILKIDFLGNFQENRSLSQLRSHDIKYHFEVYDSAQFQNHTPPWPSVSSPLSSPTSFGSPSQPPSLPSGGPLRYFLCLYTLAYFGHSILNRII